MVRQEDKNGTWYISMNITGLDNLETAQKLVDAMPKARGDGEVSKKGSVSWNSKDMYYRFTLKGFESFDDASANLKALPVNLSKASGYKDLAEYMI